MTIINARTAASLVANADTDKLKLVLIGRALADLCDVIDQMEQRINYMANLALRDEEARLAAERAAKASS